MNSAFVVGSLNIDQTIRVRSLPRAGETVRGSDAVFNPGGKGGNQARAAARAGDLLVVNEQEISVLAELTMTPRGPPGTGQGTPAGPRGGRRLHRRRRGPFHP